MSASRRLATAHLLAAIVFALAISWLALFRHSSVPHHDDWYLLDGMYRSPLFSWVFGLQQGHRLPVTLLLLYLDQTWWAGRMHLLVLAAQVCAWISVGVLALGLRRPGGPDAVSRRTLLAFGIFALFWSGSAFNFHWGVNQGSVWTVLWLLIAVFALPRARDASRVPRAAWLVLLASAAALIATFGHGIGVATWGALLAIWAATRMSWRVGSALAAGALLSAGLYSIGLFRSGGLFGQPGSLTALLTARPGDLPLFVFAFVGAPLGWALNGLGLVGEPGMLRASTAVGALLTLGTFAFGALAWRRGATLPDFSLAGFGLMVFVLVGGSIVGVMRLPLFGPAQAVNLRFLCWSIPFWIGGALALGAVATGPRARLALAGALPALSVAMLPALFQIHASQLEQDERNADVALALLLGARPGNLDPSHFSRAEPDVLDRAVTQLARTRRSPFDDERSGLVGASLAERFEASAERNCARSPATAQRVHGGDLATVRGELDPDAPAPAYVVVVDSKGVIRGLGEERMSRRADAPGRRWEGVIAGFAPQEGYAVFAVLRDRRTLCRLGELDRAPGQPGPGAGKPPT